MSFKTSLLVLPLLFSCASEGVSHQWGEAERSNSDCSGRDAHLCELERSPLEPAGSAEGYTICFVNDGFEDLAPYHTLVDQLIEGLESNAESFVAMAPELFSFVRVDLVSATAQVNDDDRFDTALGAHLRDDILLCDVPVIGADQSRVALARKSCGKADAIVLLAKESEGRALAEGSLVLMSSKDDWKVLQHELGHALFGLGDEYTEFAWCSNRAPDDPYALLPTPNVGAQDYKWQSIVPGYQEGGGHWPCLTHPTSECAMLSSDTRDFCPVCRAHIQEALDGKRCLPDTYAPRLVFADLNFLEESGALSVDIEVAAHDETNLGPFRFLLDGQVVHESLMAYLRLPLPDLLAGEHEIEVQVADLAGNVGSTGLKRFRTGEQIPPSAPIPTLVLAQSKVDEHGWLELVLGATKSERVEARIGAQLFVSSVNSGGVAFFSLPTSPTGPALVSLVAIDKRGQRSKEMRVSFRPPTEVASTPVITAARIAGRNLSLVDGIIGEVAIELSIESCAPIDLPELRGPRDQLLSIGTLVRSAACEFTATLTLGGQASAMYLSVTDPWQHQATLDLLHISSLPLGSCSAPELLEGLGSLTSPWRFAVPGGAQTTASARGPSRGIGTVLPTTASGEVQVYPIGSDYYGLDMEETSLQLTIAQDCNGLQVASATDFVVMADTVFPEVSAQKFGRSGGDMVLDMSDGGGIARVEAYWYLDDTYMVAESYPFAIPVRPGMTRLRVVDTLGNVREKELELYNYPPGTRGECAGATR